MLYPGSPCSVSTQTRPMGRPNNRVATTFNTPLMSSVVRLSKHHTAPVCRCQTIDKLGHFIQQSYLTTILAAVMNTIQTAPVFSVVCFYSFRVFWSSHHRSFSHVYVFVSIEQLPCLLVLSTQKLLVCRCRTINKLSHSIHFLYLLTSSQRW